MKFLGILLFALLASCAGKEQSDRTKTKKILVPVYIGMESVTETTPYAEQLYTFSPAKRQPLPEPNCHLLSSIVDKKTKKKKEMPKHPPTIFTSYFVMNGETVYLQSSFMHMKGKTYESIRDVEIALSEACGLWDE